MKYNNESKKFKPLYPPLSKEQSLELERMADRHAQALTDNLNRNAMRKALEREAEEAARQIAEAERNLERKRHHANLMQTLIEHSIQNATLNPPPPQKFKPLGLPLSEEEFLQLKREAEEIARQVAEAERDLEGKRRQLHLMQALINHLN